MSETRARGQFLEYASQAGAFNAPSYAWGSSWAKHGFRQPKREHGSRTPYNRSVNPRHESTLFSMLTERSFSELGGIPSPNEVPLRRSSEWRRLHSKSATLLYLFNTLVKTLKMPIHRLIAGLQPNALAVGA